MPDATLLNQAPGASGYAHNTVIDFGGQMAKFVKIDINSAWGPMPQYGLSEVRFYAIPVYPQDFSPANETVLNGLETTLSWRSGRQTDIAQVVLSTDPFAVEEGSAVVDTTGESNYTVSGLDYAMTYFWRIIDVNDAAIPTEAAGPVMTFLTPEDGAIDDMEMYADEEFLEIWDFWKDGFGDDTNGSIVGIGPNGSSPETDVVYEGAKALPMTYDNTTASKSEATRSFDPALDLTTGNPTDVGLYFHGAATGFTENNDGSITMTGIGADIWGLVDEYNYAYKTLTGDGSITARVDSVQDVHQWAKAGLMVRRSLEPGDVYIHAIANPRGRVEINVRDVSGVAAIDPQSVPDVPLPVWLRVTRSGKTFTAERSADGATWVPLITDDPDASRAELIMSDLIYVGLCVTSHTNVPCTSVFSNVSTTGNVSAGWQLEAMTVDQPDNDAASVYMKLTDSSGKSATIEHPDPAATNLTDWVPLLTPISDLNVNVSSIKEITVGVGGPGVTGKLVVDFVHVHADRQAP